MSTDSAQVVLDILARETKTPLDQIEESSELVGDLGLSSLKALQVLVEIEDRFGIEVDDEEIAGLGTVRDMLQVIARRFPAETG